MLPNVSFLVIPTNSSWIRDYSPVFFYTEGNLTGCMDMYYFPDRPEDDAFSSEFARINEMIIDTLHLYFEGGNIMFNGLGTLVTTKKLYSANPLYSPEYINNHLKSSFGLSSVIALDNLTDDETGHVDMFAKFIDERRVLVSEVYETDREDREILDINAMVLSTSSISDTGGVFEVIRIPMGVFYRSFPPGWVYHTYTNSLILNKQVFVPYYGTEFDSIAFEIYRVNMPGYEIIGVNCNAIINTGGAVHCLAVGVPENMPGIREGYIRTESVQIISSISPNPFNDYTGIEISNPYANLSVVDLNGRTVKTLVQNANLWDGRDEKNNILPSGTYFIVAEYNGQSDVKRVVLVR
jgi:agmatine/peptidylarginine deiminase